MALTVIHVAVLLAAVAALCGAQMTDQSLTEVTSPSDNYEFQVIQECAPLLSECWSRMSFSAIMTCCMEKCFMDGFYTKYLNMVEQLSDGSKISVAMVFFGPARANYLFAKNGDAVEIYQLQPVVKFMRGENNEWTAMGFYEDGGATNSTSPY